MPRREKIARALFAYELRPHPEWVPWEDQAAWNLDKFYEMADVALQALDAV